MWEYIIFTNKGMDYNNRRHSRSIGSSLLSRGLAYSPTVDEGEKTRMQKIIVPLADSIVKFYIITQFLQELNKWSSIHISELENYRAIIVVESITCIINNLHNYLFLIFCLLFANCYLSAQGTCRSLSIPWQASTRL